ncbi:hypothetical protein HK104_009385 [Borealophlyctis nickersoniae]|nr:hypothetical protein HK104_009385 [Borealophlyctis nickersoniae]
MHTMADENAPTTAADFNPKDLAESGKQTEVRRFLQLPLVLVQLALLAIILLLVVAPSSSIFIKNARDTVDDTAGVIVNITTNKAADDIKNVLTNFRVLAEDFGDRTSIVNVVINRSLPMLSLVGTPWMREYISALNMYPQVASLICLASETPDAKANRKYLNTPNVTQFGLDKYSLPATGFYSFYPLDYPSDLNYSSYKLLPGECLKYGTRALKNASGTMVPIDPVPMFAYKYNLTVFQSYAMLTSPNPENKGNGSWHLMFVPGYNILYMDYSTNFYDDVATPTVPSHRCQAGSFVDAVLNAFLKGAVPSGGSLIFIFDSRLNGSMISSSVKGSVMDIKGQGTYPVNLAPNLTVSQVGRFLRSTFNNDFTKMPQHSSFGVTLEDGREWYIGTRELRPDYLNVWQVVVAVPREDFFGEIDKSINKSIIIIAVLSVVGLILIGVVSFGLTLPLKTLGIRMSEVTQMKFSALEQGRLNRRSVIKEIAALEDTFHIMVKAFASGIRKNADLVGRRGPTNTNSTAASSPATNSRDYLDQPPPPMVGTPSGNEIAAAAYP